MGIATLIRFIFGNMAGVWFPWREQFDDALLVRYANIRGYYLEGKLPYNMVMQKEMSFPLLLNLSARVGLSYVNAVCLLWVLAALTGAIFIWRMSGKKYIFLVTSYIFMLFAPVAFDSWCGTRFYRNTILAPAYLLVISLLLLVTWRIYEDGWEYNAGTILVTSLLLAISFVFAFYIKEDGLWLLMCILAAWAFWLLEHLFLLWRHVDKFPKMILRMCILLLPLILWFGSSKAYKKINEKTFGVAESNIRTEGELGDFLANIYRIKTDDRTTAIWAPKDAIEKAFEASETLRKNQALKESIYHSLWLQGDIDSNPLYGDRLGWVMMSSVFDSQTATTPAEMQSYLAKVNAELEEAFADGRLEKDDKIQLTSGMGGRNLDEIKALWPYIEDQYIVHLKCGGYIAGAQAQDAIEDQELYKLAEKYSGSSMEAHGEKVRTNQVLNLYFKVWSRIQPLLFYLDLIFVPLAFLYALFLCLRKRTGSGRIAMIALLNLAVLMLSFVYALAIGWFVEFTCIGGDYTNIKFYSCGIVAMIVLAEWMGISLCYTMLSGRKVEQK